MTRDGTERTDVLAVSTVLPGRPTIEVQVKAATKSGERTTWQLNEKAQQPARSSHEWFVFVLLPAAPTPPRGFVVPRDHAAAAAWIVHENWRPRPTFLPAGGTLRCLVLGFSGSSGRATKTGGTDLERRRTRCRYSFPAGSVTVPFSHGSVCQQGIPGLPSCRLGDGLVKHQRSCPLRAGRPASQPGDR